MGKLILQTEKDLRRIQGKFILQINSHEPDKTLQEFAWSFVKEKRLKIVVGNGFADLYGYYENSETFEKFKDMFNSYLYPHMIEKGKTDGGRFHRLLYADELDYLLEKIKQENY